MTESHRELELHMWRLPSAPVTRFSVPRLTAVVRGGRVRTAAWQAESTVSSGEAGLAWAAKSSAPLVGDARSTRLPGLAGVVGRYAGEDGSSGAAT